MDKYQKKEHCDNCNNDVCCCIVKEEPKQETIEEVATKEGLHRASQHNLNQASAGYNAKWFKRGAVFGAKWQQERMYSEDEVQVKLYECLGHFAQKHNIIINGNEIDEWFEQLKKK